MNRFRRSPKSSNMRTCQDGDKYSKEATNELSVILDPVCKKFVSSANFTAHSRGN